METLGQDFKRRREERKLNLKDVAEATRVGVRFLTAIEADDFAALPGGIYTRSFVRAYAKFLGMDEEEVVARYRKQVATEEPAEPMMSYKEYPSESSPMSLYIGAIVLLVIILGSGYGLLQYIDFKDLSTKSIVNNSTPTPLSSPNSETTPANTIATPSPTPVFEQVVLTLKTKQDAWVSVNTDDVEKPLILTIPANSSRDFKADSKLKITIGNLPAVQAQINGQNAKLPSDNGLIAKNVVITKENFQNYITAASNPESTPTPKPKVAGLKSATGTTLPNPQTTLSPKPKASPSPNNGNANQTNTTIDPTNPDSTPTPKIKKPKPVDPDNPDNGINIPDVINSPKPKLVKPPSEGATGNPNATATPKVVPKTTTGLGTTTSPNTTQTASPKPKTTSGNTTSSTTTQTTPKPKASPKPANNTETKPN
ncbi:MAG: DUF4115 domain-containing protein [Acidobacteria bacterium]|nr:DUF4115 domain-containing protein [Acidobacteriota bacterium]